MTLTTMIAKLEEALKAATPGALTVEDGANSHIFEMRIVDAGGRCVAFADDEDARLIALMRNHLPALIEAVKRQGEALEPFALVAEHDIGSDETDTDTFRPIGHNRAPLLTVGDLRRARAALKEATDEA